MTFKEAFWVNSGKSKEENQSHKTIRFENAIYIVLHERSNDTASFAEHLKFPEQMTLAEVFWVKRGKTKQKKQNKDTIHFQIAKYRVLHERSNITAPLAGQIII